MQFWCRFWAHPETQLNSHVLYHIHQRRVGEACGGGGPIIHINDVAKARAENVTGLKDCRTCGCKIKVQFELSIPPTRDRRARTL